MAAGDVDGDGSTDIVVGADQASGLGATLADERGQVFVLSGPHRMTTSVELSQRPEGASILFGVDPGDHLGSSVACADVDGDGYGDFIAGGAAFGTLRNAYDPTGGAGDGPNNERLNAGEMSAAPPASMRLSAPSSARRRARVACRSTIAVHQTRVYSRQPSTISSRPGSGSRAYPAVEYQHRRSSSVARRQGVDCVWLSCCGCSAMQMSYRRRPSPYHRGRT
jgi:hypothetical protein